MVLRLFFVRHGLSSFNAKGLIQGRTDESYLTENGYHQAKLTGEKLNQVNIDEIYSSPLIRASETAKTIEKYLDKNLEIQYDQNLLEVDLASWSGLKTDDIKEKFKSEYKIWKSDPENLSIQRDDKTIYQPIKDLFIQAQEFIDSIIKKNINYENKNILIIAHNAILRCLILHLINKPNKGFRKIKLDNASISILNISKTNQSLKTQIECLNQTSHLKLNIPKQIGDSRIILVRHGETDWNREGRFQGQIDIPLNETGKNQALKASDYLQAIKFNKAYSSSMSRPTETAKIILGKNSNLTIIRINELSEISHGLWEGKLEKDIKNKWPEILNKWHLEPQNVIMPEGESIEDVSKRSLKAWDMICKNQNKNDVTLVVAHDAVNKTLICNILGLSSSKIWTIKQGNGGITVIDIFDDPEKDSVLSALNITTHLGNILDSTATGAL
tara:strand:+ start:1859 stop:3187 length:1329 start_codon:yes stop_codon:yes gene_type:complete